MSIHFQPFLQWLLDSGMLEFVAGAMIVSLVACGVTLGIVKVAEWIGGMRE